MCSAAVQIKYVRTAGQSGSHDTNTITHVDRGAVELTLPSRKEIHSLVPSSYCKTKLPTNKYQTLIYNPAAELLKTL